MRLRFDRAQRESGICLAAVIAIMVLTGSAILYMGAQYYLPGKTMNRFVLASPL